MKKEEKTKKTREKIIQAAIREFGTKSYELVSISSMCTSNHISKGLVYYNFKSKDDLYLYCVKLCFEKMVTYLEKCRRDTEHIETSLQELIQKRQVFFEENPYLRNIFFNAVLLPPIHLQSQIKELHALIHEYHENCYKNLLEKAKLRDDVSVETALIYFELFQETYYKYFRYKQCDKNQPHDHPEQKEVHLSRMLDIMLYGVLKKGN